MQPKSLIFVICFLLLGTVNGQNLFDRLTDKQLMGNGTLMNSPATFTMVWSKELDGVFYHLDFENRRKGKDTQEILFKAKAFYKVHNDSSVSGTWFDNRGVSFPLAGTVSENKLTIIWGTPETEQGKTVYVLEAGKGIIVNDFILNNGEYYQFGSATYPLN